MNITEQIYEIKFYQMPCYLNEIRDALKRGPLSISEIEYDTEFIYSYLPSVPQFPQFPQFPGITFDYLDFVFLFGLVSSCVILSYSRGSKKPQMIKIQNSEKSNQTQKSNVDKTKNTEIKDFDTKDTGAEIV